MTIEQAKQEIISVFSKAGKDIRDWAEHLERDEIESLLDAAARVKNTRQNVLKRQQHKIQSPQSGV